MARAPVGGAKVAQRNTAEWIVERAATIYKGYLTILPLATFSDVTIRDASFTVDAGSSVTLQYAVDHYAEYSATPPSQPYWENMYIVATTAVPDTTTYTSTKQARWHQTHSL